MEKLNFYVLWSLRDTPRQFISKSNREHFQVHIPLPLPKQLVIFGLGKWKHSEATISAEVVVSDEAKAQKIGTLSRLSRRLPARHIWEGMLAMLSSILTRMNPLSPLWEMNPKFGPRMSAEYPFYGIIPFAKLNRKASGHEAFAKSFEDVDSTAVDMSHASSHEKLRLSRVNSQEEKTTWIKDCRDVRPAKRWRHTMCLSDPVTAILMGGETTDQNHCEDSMWKLEIDNDLWFPMNSSTSGPSPPCARGHSATYDPDSKAVFVYGGLREDQGYSDMYILDTLTWKWKLVTAKGKIPSLACHSATFYKKELFIFGGVQPGHYPEDIMCCNSLYIFNPEFEIWYQPIIEGNRPLRRFGHSATLLSDNLIIFGGQRATVYLNDLHILDLGFMEYRAVECENPPPLPRGFHAALPVSANRMLVSGGCSATGALQDVHIFDMDTRMWSSVASPLLCSRPRAGHSIINLGNSILSDAEKQGEHGKTQCTVLVFGGSDCSGTFYNDTIKCRVDIPANE
ncbi:uncharacterized protein zgc:163014 [Lampris incognitus]|uniref:uncharacterized protein zgc:163014 n=1 Tax=Lampris incognitus TaxID=2546036 RepID=UPI0024B61084|nr:uncharacterized protein zgc:163014 [Lampris incognitus]